MTSSKKRIEHFQTIVYSELEEMSPDERDYIAQWIHNGAETLRDELGMRK